MEGEWLHPYGEFSEEDGDGGHESVQIYAPGLRHTEASQGCSARGRSGGR